MRMRKTAVLLTVASSLFLGSSALQGSALASTCLSTQEVSWGQWLFGRSGSVQLHFLDLLELITRRDSDRNARPASRQ